MSDWYNTFNAVFFLSLGTIVCGGVGVLLSFCFKSKCSECGLCSQQGFFYLKRDVQAENEESKMELNHEVHPFFSSKAVSSLITKIFNYLM